MPLLLLPLALVALVVWFVLSRKPRAQDAVLTPGSLSAPRPAPRLPRAPAKALPPVQRV